MKTTFARTFARLLADHGRSTVWTLAAAAAVLAAWFGWSVWSRVSLYEVSTEARLELDAATYPIESPLDGRVVETALQVGRNVRRGDVLVEIDAMPQQLRQREEQVQEQGLAPQLEQLRSQIAAEEKARIEEQESARLGAEEAEGSVRQAQIAAHYADQELSRLRALHR